MISYREWLQLDEGKKKKDWINKAVQHPGRCTPCPNPDCPVGSPQYNLAQRFKKGDIHKANKKKKKDE